jgi:hypothetical protein
VKDGHCPLQWLTIGSTILYYRGFQTLKPAIIVKDKKGKKYLQIRTVYGDLIHIGPTTVLNNWKAAYNALTEQYQLLATEDMRALMPIVRANFNELEVMENPFTDSKEFDAYQDKLVASYNYRDKLAEQYERIPNRKYLSPHEQTILKRALRSIQKK